MWRNWIARQTSNLKVMGSNPIMDNIAWVPERSKGLDSSSNANASWVRIPPHAQLDIAQLVERGTVVPQVAGSSPAVENGFVVKWLSLWTLNPPSRVQTPAKPLI